MFAAGFTKKAGVVSSLKRAVGLKPSAHSHMSRLADKALEKMNLPTSLVGSTQGKARTARGVHQLERLQHFYKSKMA
jgi:hypothetical protein